MYQISGKLDALSLYVREREIRLNVGIIEVYVNSIICAGEGLWYNSD